MKVCEGASRRGTEQLSLGEEYSDIDEVRREINEEKGGDFFT